MIMMGERLAKSAFSPLVPYITVIKTHVKSRRFCRLFNVGILPILEDVLRTHNT